MEVDTAVFLAAIVQQEGGSYTLHIEEFDKVATMTGKTIEMDLNLAKNAIEISIVDMPEDSEEIV